jgi:hypothetical protein
MERDAFMSRLLYPVAVFTFASLAFLPLQAKITVTVGDPNAKKESFCTRPAKKTKGFFVSMCTKEGAQLKMEYKDGPDANVATMQCLQKCLGKEDASRSNLDTFKDSIRDVK